jgi:hypothetical protein
MTPTLPEQLIDVLRQNPDHEAAGDSFEGWVSNKALLARAQTWGAALRETAAPDETHIGILRG